MTRQETEETDEAPTAMANESGGEPDLSEDEVSEDDEAMLAREEYRSLTSSWSRSSLPGGGLNVVPAPFVFGNVSLDKGDAEGDDEDDWVSFQSWMESPIESSTRPRRRSAHNGTGNVGEPDLEFDDRGMVEVESDPEEDDSDEEGMQAKPGGQVVRSPRQPNNVSSSLASAASQLLPTRERVVELLPDPEELTREVVRSVRSLAAGTFRVARIAAATARVLSGRTGQGVAQVAELLRESWGAVPPGRVLDQRFWR